MNVKQLFDLKDKVAIVTGGKGLYGASISLGLCEAGATVVIASRNGEKCEEYAKEKCSDSVKTVLSENKLSVKVEYCPAVKHLKATGRVVSEYFIYSTSLVMKKLAEKTNLTFNMISYDEATGKAEYEFIKEN